MQRVRILIGLLTALGTCQSPVTMYAYWNVQQQKIVIGIQGIPDNSWFAFGWGSSMTNTDMIVCRGQRSSGTYIKESRHSTGNTTPTVNAVDPYTTSNIWDLNGSIGCLFVRPLDLGANYYLAQLDTPIPCITAYN